MRAVTAATILAALAACVSDLDRERPPPAISALPPAGAGDVLFCDDYAPYADCVASGLEELTCRLWLCPVTPLGDEAVMVGAGAIVIGPSGLEGAVRFYLDDLALCRAELEPVLGPGPPVLRRRLVLADSSWSYYGTWNGVGSIVTRGPAEFFDDVASRQHDGCADPHETTHAIVADAPLPALFNEALAGPWRSPTLECDAGGYWYAYERFDYADLGSPSDDIGDIRTAACVMKLLEADGVTVADVLSGLRWRSDTFAFLADACGRPDVRPVTQEIFGLWDVVVERRADEWVEVYQ